MNTKLLLEARDAIRNEPRQFGMDDWYSTVDSCKCEVKVNCRTAACIAGWVYAKSVNKSPKEALLSWKGSLIKDHVAILLDISLDQAELLFFTYKWPYEFENAYNEARTQQEKANIACARIDHFIATGE